MASLWRVLFAPNFHRLSGERPLTASTIAVLGWASLSSIGSGRKRLEVRAYPDELSGGDEDEEPFRSVCRGEVIAQLLAIKLDLLDARTDIGFPVDHEIDSARRLVGDGDDILGDSVNIAARLEGIAEPGGICLSAAAYERVRGKLDIAVADMGEQDLKNIARPLRTYRVVL